MSLQEIMQADAAVVLADSLGEDALYLPAGGDPRLVVVAIDRQGESVNAEPRGEIAPVVVTAINSSEYGIAASEVSTQDHIRLAKVKGGEQVRMRIKRVRDENPGWIELEVI